MKNRGWAARTRHLSRANYDRLMRHMSFFNPQLAARWSWYWASMAMIYVQRAFLRNSHRGRHARRQLALYPHVRVVGEIALDITLREEERDR